jgi:hypothetical protein
MPKKEAILFNVIRQFAPVLFGNVAEKPGILQQCKAMSECLSANVILCLVL